MFTQAQKIIWLCIFVVLAGVFFTLELNAVGVSFGICATIAMFGALVGYLNPPDENYEYLVAYDQIKKAINHDQR